MVSQKLKKRIAWVLIAALINLVSVGIPGSGAIMAATHGAMALEQGTTMSMAAANCHDEAVDPKESTYQAVSDKYCPSCDEDGCSLCFQISVAMPVMGIGIVQLPEVFFLNDLPRLKGIEEDLLLPPPRPFRS